DRLAAGVGSVDGSGMNDAGGHDLQAYPSTAVIRKDVARWHGGRMPRPASVQCHDRVDLDLRRLRQPGHFDGGTGRVRRLEVLGHDCIDRGEIRQVGDVDAHAHDLRQRTAGGLRHCREVVEHPPRLHADVAVDQAAGGRIQRNLAREIHRVAGAHGLRIGADGGGRLLGGDDAAGHGEPRVSSEDAVRNTSMLPARQTRFPLLSTRSYKGYRCTPLTTPVRRTRRITSARCLRLFTSIENSKVAAEASRSTYSTFSIFESAAAIAAATVASTPGRLITSMRSCAR